MSYQNSSFVSKWPIKKTVFKNRFAHMGIHGGQAVVE